MLIIHWIPLIRNKVHNTRLSKFINQFISLAFESIHYKTPSIFFQEYNSFLQLSPNKMVGDWYFFEDHTKITIYSSKFQHFLFPKLQTPRLFPLEFIRKILNYDYIHFVSKKQKESFKLNK
jgi:hypothetical protein